MSLEKMKERLTKEGFVLTVKQNPVSMKEEKCYKKGRFYLFENMMCGIEDEWNGAVYFKQLRLLSNEAEVNYFFEQAGEVK